jgi:lipoprotein-releasing system permease protein
MNLPLLIARRYLLAKKSHQAVNIITGISFVGVGIITASLVIVLSVFNGFEGLIKSLYSTFDPDIKITALKGKYIDLAKYPSLEQKLKANSAIKTFSLSLEEQVLMRYRGKQYIAKIKGVDGNFLPMTGLSKMIREGKPVLEKDSIPYAIMGMGVAYYLGAQIEDYFEPVQLFSPNKKASASINPAEAFLQRSIVVSSFFSVEQSFDSKYVLVPLWFAKDMLLENTKVSSIEIGLQPGADADEEEAKLKQELGSDFKIKTRIELNDSLFKVLKSEKLYGYLIVCFIFLLAILNVAASMVMLIIEKSKDTDIIQFLGADSTLVKRIFQWEGLLIVVSGLVLGLVLGTGICLLQTQFGFIKLQGSGTFVVDSYPVVLKIWDLIQICGTVLCIGCITVWATVEISWKGKKAV